MLFRPSSRGVCVSVRRRRVCSSVRRRAECVLFRPSGARGVCVSVRRRAECVFPSVSVRGKKKEEGEEEKKEEGEEEVSVQKSPETGRRRRCPSKITRDGGRTRDP